MVRKGKLIAVPPGKPRSMPLKNRAAQAETPNARQQHKRHEERRP